jgi:hypothetical protein
MPRRTGRPRRTSELLDVYTKDVTGRDFKRLFTRDAPDAYRALAGSVADDERRRGTWPGRIIREIRAFLIAFGLKLSPARRALFGLAVVFALIGFVRYNSGVDLPGTREHHVEIQGAWFMLWSIGLLGLLVVLEVADRLSLKNDLDVHGLSKPANTVGGDFYDIRPLADGRVLVAVGDVAGKGSPAALLMALFLAMERVLLDELTDLVPLTTRLNGQIVRQAPGTRFITLFAGAYDPATGTFEYVNAGHPPALVRRADGTWARLQDGGIALGLFEGAEYRLGVIRLEPGDFVAIYSDGITEAEHPATGYFDEAGLERSLTAAHALSAADICRSVFEDVKAHTDEGKLADDLTILVLRRP